MSSLIGNNHPERNYGWLGSQINSSRHVEHLNQFQGSNNAPLSNPQMTASLSGVVTNAITEVQGVPGPSGSGLAMTEKAQRQYDLQLFSSAYRDARQRSDIAQDRLRAVESGNPAEISRFEKFFGTYSDNRFDVVKGHFGRADRVFSGQVTIDYSDFGSRPSFTAWPGQSDLLASGKIGNRGVTGDGLALDLLHEVMHVQASTSDDAYSRVGVTALAARDPEKAINNAHSLAHYAFSR